MRASPALETLNNYIINNSDYKAALFFTHDTNIAPIEQFFEMSDDNHRPRFTSFI